MQSFLLHALLLFSSIQLTAALAVFGRQLFHNRTIPGPNKRQGTAVVTKLSTIFVTGDASKTRTANPGFDIRVDLINDLFGFCPTSVIAATDCGLAGSCVDSFSCSRGCGFTDMPLTTFTCSQSREPFCSTALLTLSGNVGPFSYIGCGPLPTTDQYFAFTTSSSSAKSTSSTQSTSTSSTTFSDSAGLPSGTSASLSSNISTTGQSPPRTDAPTDTASSGAEGGGNAPANNIGAIIGGVVGCLALLCGCGVAIVWIIRRNNSKNDKTPSVAPADDPGPTPEKLAEHAFYKSGGWMPRELSAGRDGDGPPGELPARMTPVELPGYYPNGGI